MEDYQDRLAISTPEGLQVELVLAGLGSRFTAALLDLVIKAVVLLGVVIVFASAGSAGLAIVSIAVFVVYVGYDIAFEVLSGGQTPGKKATHLRVLRTDGRPVDFLSSGIRNTVRLVEGLGLAYVPGMIAVLVTSKNQRIGDLFARTIVVREHEVAAAAIDLAPPAPAAAPLDPATPPPLPAAPRPSWAGTLDVTAITPTDLAALRSFLQRRHQLEGLVRADIARRLGGAIRPRVGGGVDTLHDEQLIERVVWSKDLG